MLVIGITSIYANTDTGIDIGEETPPPPRPIKKQQQMCHMPGCLGASILALAESHLEKDGAFREPLIRLAVMSSMQECPAINGKGADELLLPVSKFPRRGRPPGGHIASALGNTPHNSPNFSQSH